MIKPGLGRRGQAYVLTMKPEKLTTPVTKLAGCRTAGLWKHFALYCDKIQSSSLGIEVGELHSASDGVLRRLHERILLEFLGGRGAPTNHDEEFKKNWAELTWDDIDWSEGSPSPRGLFDLVEEFRRKLLSNCSEQGASNSPPACKPPSLEGAHWTWTLDKTMPECSDEGDTITLSEYQDEYNPASSNDPFNEQGRHIVSNTTVYRVFKQRRTSNSQRVPILNQTLVCCYQRPPCSALCQATRP